MEEAGEGRRKKTRSLGSKGKAKRRMANSSDGPKVDGKHLKTMSESDDRRSRKRERKRCKADGKRLKTISEGYNLRPRNPEQKADGKRLKTISQCDDLVSRARRSEIMLRYSGAERFVAKYGIHPDLIALNKRKTKKFAITALEFYNEQNPGADFELVEPIVSQVFVLDFSVISHVNFTAKPKNSACDASQKLFFAELSYLRRDILELKGHYFCRCSIVDDTNSKITSGCGYCNPSPIKYWPKIYHVDGVFHYGCFEYGTRPTHLTRPFTKGRFGSNNATINPVSFSRTRKLLDPGSTSFVRVQGDPH